MLTTEHDLFAHFDALLALQPDARAAALATLDVDASTREQLAALLDADASSDTRLERAIEGGAKRLSALSGGLRLGPWRVLLEIGAGGMGTVFLGERADGAFQQQVALKVLRGFPTADGMRRLRQERQVLATLEHRYIARLIDGGETDEGQPYFVMEFVEGEPATVFVAKQGLNVAARVALVDRIAEAIAHAHQRLVIHRDLKPSNVLVRSDGTPRLLDFGVAKLIDAVSDSGGTSTRVWTPGYASPEQRAGESITTATDVFALGVLLNELLTGRRPDGAACNPPLAAVAVDADLRGIVAKASADEVSARYQTVEALRDDLARWRDGRPVRAARDTAFYRVRKFVRRHRVGVAASLIVAGGIAAFVVGLERALSEAQSQREIAQRVGDFMVDMLNHVPPSHTEGRELTAREVVAIASRRLLGDADVDVQVRVRLLERLAMVNINFRDLDAARKHIEAADALRMEVSPRVRAGIDYTFARILARTGDMDGAMQRNDAALALAGVAGGSPGLLVSALQQAMWLANRRGDYRRTLELAPKALAIVMGSEQAMTNSLAILNTRSFAEGKLGHYDAELASLRMADDLTKQGAGESTLIRSNVSQNLAFRLRQHGRLDEAREVLDRVEAYGREAFATENRGMWVRILVERAQLEAHSGDAERALRAVDEAIAVDSELPATQRFETLWAVRAEVLYLVGRPAEALQVFDASAISVMDAVPGDDINAAFLRALRSAVLCAVGRNAEAANDAATATLRIAKSPPWLLQRLAIERRLAELPAACGR